MKKTIHRSENRGTAEHGWLSARHSFSFGDYYNPEKMGFGLLRVLNDDRIEPGQGFGTHPHRDMEIVTVPLGGSLKHKDSEGNEATIRHGEVQAMSAGSGVLHSEFNPSPDEPVNLLQIWVMPERRGIEPRYDQKEFPESKRVDRFQQLVGPLNSAEDVVRINQQAFFSMANLRKNHETALRLRNPQHGLYLFVISGEVEVAGEVLGDRDAVGLEEFENLIIQARDDSQVLAIEVPMR